MLPIGVPAGCSAWHWWAMCGTQPPPTLATNPPCTPWDLWEGPKVPNRSLGCPRSTLWVLTRFGFSWWRLCRAACDHLTADLAQRAAMACEASKLCNSRGNKVPRLGPPYSWLPADLVNMVCRSLDSNSQLRMRLVSVSGAAECLACGSAVWQAGMELQECCVPCEQSHGPAVPFLLGATKTVV